ncbi:MAG: flagellar basal body-associated FliL family protein [Bdellovibrionales bacterium]|nr:flagellar basal body-associated FliL family protein [Bdellovibrionales bacterium]
MAAEEEEGTPEGQAEEAKPKSKKMLFIIVGVVVLLAAGGGAFFFLGGSDEKEGEGDQMEVEDVSLATAELPEFVVNLSQNTSFLKTRLLVEYDPDVVTSGKYATSRAASHEAEKMNLPGVLGEREPMIKDAVILVLAAKSPQELLTSDGKEALKEELVEAINDATGLDEEAVTNVYFLEFIIQ